MVEQERRSAAMRFCDLPLRLRLADVCRACGQHMLSQPEARVALLERGGDVTCIHCGAKKVVEPQSLESTDPESLAWSHPSLDEDAHK